MILRRLGNKKKIAKEIQKYFPPHKIYIEPFFGAGGMFFNKPKVDCNIMNDLDSDVFNLFNVVSTRKDELEELFLIMPKHQDLLNHWKENQETDEIRKALRFLFLSNYTFLGKQDTLKLNSRNDVKSLYKGIIETNKMIYEVQFANMDFRKFLKSVSIESKELIKTFIYCDSPYLNTVDTYSDSDTWIERDTEDLFNTLEETKCKFAMSEFDHPFILEQAKQRNLNVIIIGERQNLKNRRTEILVTNYSNSQQSLF
jgi:DNA adenine methylase